MAFSNINAQAVGVQFEKVSKLTPQLYSLSQLTRARIKKLPAEKVSAWTAGSGAVLGYRLPIQQYAGGDFANISLDNGTLPTGSMGQWQYMALAYNSVGLFFNLSNLAMMATGSSEQSSVNVFKNTIDNAWKIFGAAEDALFYTAGDGILANGIGTGAAPSGTNPVYTLEPNFGPQRIYLGQLVDVYNAAGSVVKGTGLYAAAIDPVAKTVTLTGTVTSPANDDVIAISGMSATLAAGSSRYGLYNYQSSTTSGSTGGLSRTTVPELVTPSYTANAALSAPMGLLLSDYMIQRRDEKALANMTGISHMAQREAYFVTGDSISEFQVRDSNIATSLDRVPRNLTKEAQTFEFAGVTHLISKFQNRSRIDWVDFDDFVRVNLADPDYLRTQEGQYIFQNRASTGAIKTGIFFGIVSTENIGKHDPGRGGILQSLTIPTGM